MTGKEWAVADMDDGILRLEETKHADKPFERVERDTVLCENPDHDHGNLRVYHERGGINAEQA